MAADTVSTSTRVHRRAEARDRSRLDRLSRLGRFVTRAWSLSWEVVGEAAALLIEVGPRAGGATGATRPTGTTRSARDGADR